MRSRWWCAGGGVGSLRQRVFAFVNLSHGHGDKLHPFHPTLLGLRDFAVECNNGRHNAMASLLITVKEFRRGISSSSLVCAPADSSNSHSSENGDNGINNGKGKEQSISFCEAKKLMRLVNVESLKMKLGTEGKEAIPYSELLEACETMGLARNAEEAVAFAKVLDEAGVILLFRDKVYLHPEKVVELIRRAVPLALTAENDDPMREELRQLQERKEQIDTLAHKQVRRILWCGLGGGIILVGFFFRLTFWDFTWDIMEPIAFFTTTLGLIIGYAYFLITSRDPTYQDFMKRLFISRQRKLFKRQNFDIERFRELQKKLKTPLDASTALRKRVGVEPDPEDVLHRD